MAQGHQVGRPPPGLDARREQEQAVEQHQGGQDAAGPGRPVNHETDAQSAGSDTSTSSAAADEAAAVRGGRSVTTPVCRRRPGVASTYLARLAGPVDVAGRHVH